MTPTTEIEELRSQLDAINIQFFEIVKKRQRVVTKIQSLKNNGWSNRIWVPAREFKLFKDYCFATEKNFELDQIYSLLIEKQARVCGDYPAWSLCEHLAKVSGNKFERMNPILLFIRNKSEYHKLELKNEYTKDLKEVLNNEV